MIKNPSWVYFWWSASNVYGAKFINWVVTRMHTGDKDTNKLGVGVLVESDWLFDKIIVNKIPYGCKRGQYILAPYDDLYRSYESAWKHKGKIKRPTVEQVREFNR
jgi:hypothetical protein